MATADREIGRIAARQHNVVTREQLLSAGLGARTISRWCTAGWLQRQHRGVFLLGPAPPTLHARARAATFSAGPGAAVSHRAAAVLLGLPLATPDLVDVTVPDRNPGRRPGLRLHRCALPRGEVITVRGIPITTAARTICDLAACEPPAVVEDSLTAASVQGLVTGALLLAALDRAPSRSGAPWLRTLIDDDRAHGYTRSRAERLMRGLLRDAGLPLPHFNAKICGYEVDGLWRSQSLIYEVDGRQFHSHPAAFETDRKRDQVLVAAGFRVVRITWRQLTSEPVAVAVRLAQTLGRAAA